MTVPPVLGDASSVPRKVLTTVGLGGATFVVTNALNLPQDTSFVLSILIGGIALILRFLVDFERRLSSVEVRQEQALTTLGDRMEGGLAEISEATELFGLIENSALKTGLITDLVRNATQISRDSPPIVYQFVQTTIRDTSQLLKQLADGGSVTYYGEDRDWLLGLTRNATAGIDAISMAAVDHDLWQSEIGQFYLDAQRRAVVAGKRVRRIFIMDGPVQVGDEAFAAVWQEQQRMRIEVRVLRRTDIPAPLRVQVRDVIVFDDTLAYETIPTTADPALAQVSETRLVLIDARVKDCVQLFRELWEIAAEPR
jgi:hypothetical protein